MSCEEDESVKFACLCRGNIRFVEISVNNLTEVVWRQRVRH